VKNLQKNSQMKNMFSFLNNFDQKNFPPDFEEARDFLLLFNNSFFPLVFFSHVEF